MLPRFPALVGLALALTATAALPEMDFRLGMKLAQRAALKPVMVEADEEPPPPPRKAPEEFLARRTIERESFHDPANPDLERLQRMDEVTRHMPFDANGFPDWMKAIRDGTINPRQSLTGKDKMQVLDLDIIMRNTKEMPKVRFPHLSHTLWLDCANCHPYPFKPQAGSNEIRMADIFRGKFCGMCHDRVAFITFFSCVRCHSVPQPAQAGGPAVTRQ